MTDKTVSLPETPKHSGFIKNNLRNYGMLLSLLAIMLFFQIVTDGTLLQPVNLTNLVLQNSYIVIMALGMLLVIVTGHIDLSVGSVAGFVGAVAAVAGNACYYYAPSGVSAGSSTVVTSDLSDSAKLGAGILQSAPANNEYCWIQIK